MKRDTKSLCEQRRQFDELGAISRVVGGGLIGEQNGGGWSSASAPSADTVSASLMMVMPGGYPPLAAIWFANCAAQLRRAGRCNNLPLA